MIGSALLQLTEYPAGEYAGQKMFVVSTDRVSVGSSVAADWPLASNEEDSEGVYFTLERQGLSYFITPGEASQITLNGRQLLFMRSTKIVDGDVVRASGYSFLFSCEVTEPASAEILGSEDDSEIMFDPASLSGDHDLKDSFTLGKSPVDYLEDDDLVTLIRRDKHKLGEGSEFSDLERKIDLVLDGIQDQRRQQQDMMRVVDRATVEFIKEFSPEMLEDIIGESKAYSFGKHWRSYKKFYQKRSDSGYFVRQYRAILLECLQQK